MTIINSKTLARIAAIQVLYQITMSNSVDSTSKIISQIIDYYEDKEILNDHEVADTLKLKLHKALFNALCEATLTNIINIDDIIKKYLSNEWPFENLHVNLKAILRCGVAELVYFPEVPVKVIINEYTNISSDMLKGQEVGFINSILDTISKEIRKYAS